MALQPWDKLSSAEKDLYITLLWKDGHSDNAIGDLFGTTKNAIVGYRHKKLPDLSHRDKSVPVKSKVDPERFRDLLDLYTLRLRDQGNEGTVIAQMFRSVAEP